MCHWIRQDNLADNLAGSHAPQPPGSRQRWAVAGAATVLAGLAAAAIVAPSAPAEPHGTQQTVSVRAAPAQVVPATAAIEQTAAGLDDGVPTAPDVARSALGHCHEGV